MISKHYILASHDALAKRYIRERSNLGMIPATIKIFLQELYYHPLFALDSSPLVDTDSFSQDVMMASLGQKLTDTNYFKKALEIRGNRKLLLNALLELKLSGVESGNIEKLKLDNIEKSEGLIELYRAFNSAQNSFNYPDLVHNLEQRISSGKYDKILSHMKLSCITEIDFSGKERPLFDLIKSKMSYTEFEKPDQKHGDRALGKFQDYLATKTAKTHELDDSLICASAITYDASVFQMFGWMKQVSGTNKDTDILLLNYEELAPEIFRVASELKYPIYLTKGLKCLHFSFYSKILTVLASYSHFENNEYLSKAQMYLLHMSGEPKEDSFRKKALSVISDLKNALPKYHDLKLEVDVHKLLVRELKSSNLSAKELDQDETGLWIGDPLHVAGLRLENVGVFGLSNSQYPKKKTIDPVLKADERIQIKKSLSVELSLEALDPWDKLLENLCAFVGGNLLLTYNSHDLSSGKLTVPSSFFNHVLSFTGQEVEIKNVYKLCSVKQSFLEDIDHKNEFQSLNRESSLAFHLEARKNELASKDLNEMDYGKWEEIKADLSATSLEAFFTCPHKFHLKYHKKLRPKDLNQNDSSEWLSSSEKGNFVHKTFENLLLPFLGQKDYADFLATLSEETIKKVISETENSEDYKNINVHVAPHIKQAELQEILEETLFFIHSEKTYAESGYYPLFVEHPFEYECKVDETTFQFSGKIDRVDTDGSGNYRVIDYKTGKFYFKKNQTSLFYVPDKKTGKVYFQHAIYSLALTEDLKGKNQEIKSLEASYYFSSEKGKWKRISHTANDASKEFISYLKNYLDEAKTQKYFKNPNSCTFCEYKSLCKGEQDLRAKLKIPCEQTERILEVLMKDHKNA